MSVSSQFWLLYTVTLTLPDTELLSEAVFSLSFIMIYIRVDVMSVFDFNVYDFEYH